MLQYLSDIVAEICSAEDLRQVDAALRRGTAGLGFISYNLTVGKKAAAEFMTAPTLTTWTREDLLQYDREGWSGRDPLLVQASAIGPTIGWQLDDCHHAPEYREYLNSVGLGSGITVPLTQQGGALAALSLLGLGGERPDAKTVHATRIIGLTAQSRLVALGHGTVVNGNGRLRDLTPRQREILHWASLGKTNAEIGIIMGQSSRGIEYHMGEILRKLAVRSRIQAIVIYARENA